MTAPANRLALWLVPAGQRELAAALFALADELAAIPHKVREPTLGLMRVIWWRDAILALADGPAPAQPLLQRLTPFRPQVAQIADWAETFDRPFVAPDEQADRLAERQRLAGALIGVPAAAYLAWAARHPVASPLRLAWQALKAARN